MTCPNCSCKPEPYDMIVIGGGSAGLVTAAVAAPLGYKVALLEGHKMGGDCLNYGCVPSKALLAAAKVAHTASVGKQFGIACSKTVNFPNVMAYVKDVITKIEPHDSAERFRKLGVDVIEEYGHFINKKTIATPSGRKLTARRIVVATGSRASIPPIPGLADTPYLTNETIFDLTEQPEHLLIIGGGPVGVEMAQAFVRLDSKVTLLQAAERILPHDAPELTAELQEILTKEGVTLHTSATVKQVNAHEKGISLAFRTGNKNAIVHGSHVLVAAGRVPNTEKLQLKNAKIKTTEHGIIVNQNLRTKNKRVYALGDVAAGQPNFTHMAGEMATVFIKRVLFGSFTTKADFANRTPWVTYTDPELAHTGLTKAQAVAQYGAKNIRTTTVFPQDVDRYVAEQATAGKMQVITKKNGTVLGVDILAQGAGELLPTWGLMISQKLKLSALSSVIHPYPTKAELSRKAVSLFYKPSLYAKKTKRVSRILYRLLG